MAINPNDPRKPNDIWARAFSSPIGQFRLRAHGETVRLWAEAFGSESKMGEYAGLVHGVVLQDDGTPLQLSDGLISPTAVFKGLKRPLHHFTSQDDRNVYIYITNPRRNFRYPRERQFTGGPLEPLPPLPDSVFAVYVMFEQELVDAESTGVAQEDRPVGLVIGWEWLEESKRVRGLPYDYDSRFESRVY